MLLAWHIVEIKTSRSRSKIQYDVSHAAYDRVKNSVFRRFLRVSSDVDDVTVGDRLTHWHCLQNMLVHGGTNSRIRSHTFNVCKLVYLNSITYLFNLAEFTCPRRTCSRRTYPRRTCPRRTCPRRTCPRRTCPRRTCPRRTCPRRTYPRRTCSTLQSLSTWFAYRFMQFSARWRWVE